jgi:hypothetical protein
MKLERVVRFFPGYNHLNKPGDQRGWHTMEIFFGITDEEKGLSVSFVTPWAPPDVNGNPAPYRPRELSIIQGHPLLDYRSLGFHYASKPEDSEGSGHHDACWLLDGECWFHDSAAMQGLKELVVDFVEHGDDVVWDYLERKWEQVWHAS